MPTFCAVINCGTVGGHGVSMFRFPSKYDNHGKLCPLADYRLQKWTQALKRADLTENKIKYERVCGKHFISGKKAALDDKDNPDWVPSLQMGHNSSILSKPCSTQRYERVHSRANKRKALRIQNDAELNEDANIEITAEEVDDENNVDPPKAEGNLEDALIAANSEIYTLRERLAKYKYTREAFERDNEKCLYYTGLPNIKYLDVVYQLVEPYLNNCNSSLSKFEQLVLTLMKLRKNFDFKELGFKFEVDRRTSSRCFHNCLFVLYRRLKQFLIWPDRETLRLTMPLEFKSAFRNKVAVIIDCFEVFTETPSTVQAASQTFSHYKHHNTVKFLIGITPRGVISFISGAFGGRCSDKFITENSGFLEKLLPGDAILADRGFLINESAQLYLAEVIMPAFLKGQKQLSPADVEKTRKIANLRIHVERVIGVVRQKYNILGQIIPITLLNDKNSVSTIDQIVHVCCGLTNLCPSVVNLL